MRLFSLFRKNKSTANINTEENMHQETCNDVKNDENKNDNSGFFDKLKEKKEHKEREKFIIDSLKPYKCSQKIIIWNNGFREVVYGYPFAMIDHKDDYIILYRKRPYDFLDEIIIKLKAIFFGYKDQYRILKVPKYLVSISEEIITVYANNFIHLEDSGKLVEYAIPIEGHDPRKRIFWEIEREKAMAYRRALYKILNDELPDLLERALQLNPAFKVYQGLEAQPNKKKKVKAFDGVEISFDRGNVYDYVDKFMRGENEY